MIIIKKSQNTLDWHNIIKDDEQGNHHSFFFFDVA